MICPLQKPPIHLWIYNHPFFGISDQVAFFASCLRQHDYSISIGRRPRESALNVVIENFPFYNRDILIGFCKTAKKRVAVILTEHMDFKNGQLLFHGAALGAESHYMHRSAQIARFRSLLECLPQISCFLVLGDLPRLQNIGECLLGVEIRSIPFPDIDGSRWMDQKVTIQNDLVFTGALTEHRKQVLASLRAEGFRVAVPDSFISMKRRNALNKSAKLILNIPQSPSWRWLSPMRVIAGLACGRPTVSIGRMEPSCISRCCTEIDMQGEQWRSEMKRCVEESESFFQRTVQSYSNMAKEFEVQNPFPHDVFGYWGMIERIV